MKIFVLQTWTGTTISLQVKGTDTIGSVKSAISDRLEVPTNDQILLYREQLLQVNFTLLDYEIPENATLHLRLRLGGM